ncbi:hypothetical protein A7A08_01953 [Methyloligella halotolerans]|uniref:Uncharacterized protein n=1 Tax=Methyloligella halotolerans TaxID=1177755 RepID=A0A1E2RY86_9HYPH|nr:hypothetical protein [Methyloligella halotolerans]ODA67206.1 hypothetical protein A7A08_01953 [Methyloligella halotolerans]
MAFRQGAVLVIALLCGPLTSALAEEAATSQKPAQDVQQDTVGQSASEDASGDPAKPKCEIAEVNPVTGHAICIKPIGAPVEKPPEVDDAGDCLPGDESTADWSWSSKCRPETVGQ